MYPLKTICKGDNVKFSYYVPFYCIASRRSFKKRWGPRNDPFDPSKKLNPELGDDENACFARKRAYKQC